MSLHRQAQDTLLKRVLASNEKLRVVAKLAERQRHEELRLEKEKEHEGTLAKVLAGN